jgi:hypothetical protein
MLYLVKIIPLAICAMPYEVIMDCDDFYLNPINPVTHDHYIQGSIEPESKIC